MTIPQHHFLILLLQEQFSGFFYPVQPSLSLKSSSFLIHSSPYHFHSKSTLLSLPCSPLPLRHLYTSLTHATMIPGHTSKFYTDILSSRKVMLHTFFLIPFFNTLIFLLFTLILKPMLFIPVEQDGITLFHKTGETADVERKLVTNVAYFISSRAHCQVLFCQYLISSAFSAIHRLILP